MADNAQTMDDLQAAVSLELAAVSQYMLHALTAETWGLDNLAIQMRTEMLEELGHAQAFARRMVFLGGAPELRATKVPLAATRLQDMFVADLVDEGEGLSFYTDAARTADAAGDIGTRELFKRTALEEERHMAWLTQQISLLERMGEMAFVAIQGTQASGKYSRRPIRPRQSQTKGKLP